MEEELPVETMADAELFGHMIRIGLALTEPNTFASYERTEAIRRYDELAQELNRRQALRKKEGRK